MAKPRMARLGEIVSEINIAHQDILQISQGNSVQIYIDTADVRRAILGAQEYVTSYSRDNISVNVNEFNKNYVLADCLLAAEFLGSFSMLAPHQAEFLRQLRGDEVFRRIPTQLDQSTFLQKVGIENTWIFHQNNNLSEADLKSFLKKYAGNETERFFKAIQCVRLPWWEQLRRIRDNQIFLPINDEFDYSKLLKSKALPKLLLIFQRRRGRIQHEHLIAKNNFTDAISLLMLVELARRYRDGESNKIPRFFDSTGLFHEVIREAELEQSLIISVSGLRSSVLINSKYLTYRASLTSSTKDEKVLYTELKNAIPGEKQPANEVSRLETAMIERKIRSLTPQVQRFVDLSFLENVWLKTMAKDELHDIVSRWTGNIVHTEKFRETIETTIDEAVADVLKGADEYKRFSGIWLGLRTEVLEWRHKVLPRALSSQSIRNEIELDIFRVSPSLEVSSQVIDLLESLADDSLEDSEVTGTEAWHNLMTHCADIERLNYSNSYSKTTNKADFVCAALWAVGANSRILDLIKSAALLKTSFCVSASFAAATLRQGRDARRIEVLIRDLHNHLLIQEATPKDQNSRPQIIAMGSTVAYLWFHLWQTQWKLPAWWRCNAIDISESRQVEIGQLLKNAIECVEIAWRHSRDLFSPDDELRSRQVYIANQRLYYLVEQGNDQELNEMVNMYTEMAGYRTHAKDHWRSTYSDTLARYFAYRAFRTSKLENRQRYMQSAEDNFQDAISVSKSDPTVRLFGEYLIHVNEHGFGSHGSDQSAVRKGHLNYFENSSL